MTIKRKKYSASPLIKRTHNELRVELLNPHDLTQDYLSEWRLFQSFSPALASPYLTPEFARLVCESAPMSWWQFSRKSGRTAGFLPFERRGRTGKPVGGALSDCQAVIAAPWWDWNPSRTDPSRRSPHLRFHPPPGRADSDKTLSTMPWKTHRRSTWCMDLKPTSSSAATAAECQA